MPANLATLLLGLIAAAIVYFLMFWPFVRLVSRLQNRTAMSAA